MHLTAYYVLYEYFEIPCSDLILSDGVDEKKKREKTMVAACRTGKLQ